MRGTTLLSLLLLLAAPSAASLEARAQDGDSREQPPAEPTPPPQPLVLLADASPIESEALNRLASSRAWTSRALAAMRLERYDCPASAGRLISLTRDPSWRVRAYAFAVLARRGIVIPADILEGERDARVVRTILRGRYEIPLATIDAQIANIERSQRPIESMVALEVLAALDRGSDDALADSHENNSPEDKSPEDKEIRERMDELLGRVVLRMSRTEAGSLSPRLAAITAGPDSGRDYRWREWYRKGKNKPGFEPAAIVPSAPAGERLVPPNKVAELDAAGFIAFEGYLASVADRPMDLALLIDCTASMWRELSDAQSSADDLVEFLGSVTGGVRIAIIGYRDRTDAWETKAWDFTRSIDEARSRLWSLSAEGGGDEPESVHAAMKTALGRFSWLPDARPPSPQPIRALVLVGDAPPHPGEGTLCVELAKKAFARGVRTYGIVARDQEANLKEEGSERAKPPTDAEKDERKGDKKPRGKKDGEGSDPDSPVGRNGQKQVEPPKAPPPAMRKKPSHTWFPEIAEAGGGRAEIIKDDDSLVAEIAELTIADKYRAEFRDFFAAFRVLCR
ncbi:MAG: hypothetical protein RLY21_2608 [Planctomycetota bacterium]